MQIRGKKPRFVLFFDRAEGRSQFPDVILSCRAALSASRLLVVPDGTFILNALRIKRRHPRENVGVMTPLIQIQGLTERLYY